MVEPNLTMIIRRIMRDIDDAEVRSELAERIRGLFSLPRGEFNAVLSPAGPYEVPDEVGDTRPLLVVMSHESTAVPSDLRQPPPDIAEIFEYKGTDRKIRELKNNLVFVAADERTIPNMRGWSVCASWHSQRRSLRRRFRSSSRWSCRTQRKIMRKCEDTFAGLCGYVGVRRVLR
jgi:hypothetical protein